MGGTGEEATAVDQTDSFGVVLSRFRVAAGLTQEELAERAGLSSDAISTLERGVRTRPRPHTVRRLVEALALSADDRVSFERVARAESSAPPHEATLPVGGFLGALPSGTLIGREEDSERCRAALDALEEGIGRVLLLTGEVGIGKTRLLQELMVEARARGYVVLTGRCTVGDQRRAYSPIAQMLGHIGGSLPAATRTEIQRRVKLLRHIMDTAPSGDAEPSARGAATQEQFLWALSDLLLLVARSVPVVLLLDDLQWADVDTLRVMEHLTRSLHGSQVLTAAALRDTRLTEEHPELAQVVQRLNRERLAERVVVRRLSLEETARLVATIMGEQAPSDEFASFVYRRTKGVPRLIDQLIRSLGERLELQEEIGAGAMGRVFRAFDRATEQTVAAKLVLARQEIDLDTLLRFQQEGAVLAQLGHPHIVDIYDSFVEEHAACIIMELLEGRSLGQLLADGPLPLERAKLMGMQVADALAYAHSQGIIHRDIKPDNVMVLLGDQVKVTDFGIARILRPDTSLQTIATTGMRMGTPLYMAPEQIEGKRVDGRTDIYALGAMLYHMVTGRPPFEGSDALSVAVKHLQEEPVPPSRINPAVPADWDALILKAMAKDPSRRFQSAQEMQEAIAALGEVTFPQSATFRRRWRLAAAAGLIALAAVAFGGFWAHGAQNQEQPGPAARIDAYLAQHHFSGYILLERHGRVLLSKGYGMADRKANLPNTVHSEWPVPGTNRFMTAIAILRLQDQHRLSVHDKLCRYITGCPGTWRPITIHQLLLDTSGLGTFDTRVATGGVSAALARCKTLPLAGAPGAITAESRCNNLLLNTIIVKVSGKPWAAAMQELLFGPAHMTESGLLTNALKPPLRVQGYHAGLPTPPGNFDNYYVPYSSVQDLERMDRAVLSGRLLSRRALRTLFTPYLSGGGLLARYLGIHGTALAGCYECYLRQASSSTVAVVDHPGTYGSFGADDALSPDDGTIAIMMKNDESGPDPTAVFFGLASHLLWGKQTSGSSPLSPVGKRIAAYLTRNMFSGYVYLERHGQVILNRGYGMADVEDKLPNTAQTKWPAFNDNRFLLAVAILRLQEQGKLSTRNKICSYIAGCPAAWQPITIQEVLTNTSGIAGYDPFSPGVTVDRTMADCKAMPLVSSPGSISPWSECNSFLLSTVLQQVTGTSWEAAMQNLVFGPAGMTNSGRMTNALKPPQRGRFYSAGTPSPELNYDGTYLAYTTVEDSVRLNHALLAGTLLSPQSLTALFKPWVQFNDRFPDGREVWYGYQSVMALANGTLSKVVHESDIDGTGEDNQGWKAGFYLTVVVSPDDGAIAIDVTNDAAYFTNDADNTFSTLIAKPLYGK